MADNDKKSAEKPKLTPDEERKAKAARAKKLLNKKRKEKAENDAAAATASEASGTPRGSVDMVRDGSNGSVAVNGIPGSPLITEKEAIVKSESPLARDLEPVPEAVAAPRTETVEAAHAASPKPPSSPLPVAQDTPKAVTPVPPPDNVNISVINELKVTNANLASRIQELEVEVASLRTDSGMLAEARGIVDQLEAEKAELEIQVKSQEDERLDAEGARKELREREVALASMTQQAEMTDEDLAAAKRELDEAHARAKEMEQKMQTSAKELEARLERQREREGGLEGEIVRLREAHKEAESSRSGLQESLDTVKADHTSATDGLDQLRQQYEALQSEHAVSTSSLDSRTAELETVRAAAAEDQQTVQSQSATILKLEQQLSGARSEVERLKAELAQQTKKAEQAFESRGGLQQDNRDLMEQLEEMRTRLGDVIAEREDAVENLASERKRVEELETSLQATSATKEDDETALQKIRLQLQAAKSDLGLLRNELDATSKEASDADQETQALRKEMQEIKRQMDSTRLGLVEAASQLEAEIPTTADHKAIVAAISKQGKALADRAAELEQQISEARAATEALKAKSAQTTASASDDSTAEAPELSTISAKLRAAEEALHAESSRSHNLARQLTDTHVEIARLSREREEAIAKLAEPSPSRSSMFRSATSAQAGPSAPPLPPPGQYTSIPTVRPAIDQNLPPSARHKRQVSLALLRARMGPSRDGLVPPQGASRPGAGRSISSRSTSMMSVSEADDEDEVKAAIASEDAGALEEARRHLGHGHGHGHGLVRSQFGDEAVFWCANCEGDLITL